MKKELYGNIFGHRQNLALR